MSTAVEQIQAAIEQHTGFTPDSNFVVRDHLRIIGERQLTRFGTAIGDERFNHLWWPGDFSNSSDYAGYSSHYRQHYPDATFLLYYDGEVHKVDRLTFFSTLHQWYVKEDGQSLQG